MKALLTTIAAFGSMTMATDTTAPETDAFAIQMFSTLADRQEGNLVYSPASAEQVLHLLKQGARGSTAAELNALPLGKRGIKHSVTPDIANALFVDNSLTLKPGLKADTIMRVPFADAPAEALTTINNWAAEMTKDRIPTILTPGDITPNTRLIAANAIYMKAEWFMPFDPDFTRENTPFTLADGRIAKVDMMRQREDFFYAEGEDWQAIALYYSSNVQASKNTHSTCFIGILPKGNAGEFARTLTPQKYQDIRKALTQKPPQDTIVYLPRFEIEMPTFSLKEALSACGLGNIFSSSADFSGFCDTALILSDVLQRCYIKVNESGTEAAAVTEVIWEEGCCAEDEPRQPNVIRFNRPFIWVIGDLTTPAAPYFMGIIEEP